MADMPVQEALIMRIAAMDVAVREAMIGGLNESDLITLCDSWAIWARPAQLPPPWHWRVWLIMAGRGFGKTRAGAEWVHHVAQNPGARIAIVGATEEEARRVMVEGAGGLLASGPVGCRPVWEVTRGIVRWPNGAQAQLYSAAAPDSLRGPEHSHGWCDEIAKWARAEEAWDNLRMGMRQGRRPQIVATTTPRQGPLLRRLTTMAGVAVTRGKTTENRFLPREYVGDMLTHYAGRRIGRQELDGELLDDFEDALWTRDVIEACRVQALPELRRVVVGVDPPAGSLSGRGGDACGIVVAALGRDGCVYIVEDASVAGQSPEGWARAVAGAAARHGADRVVAEANNGGAMVDSVLRAADAALPVTLVHASHGKVARAEPVSLRYARGGVKHLGAFPELEDELCGLIIGGGYEGPGRSPDRADALVWAVTALLQGRQGDGPRVRGI